MKRLITTKAAATLMAAALVTSASCSGNGDNAAQQQQMPAPQIGTQTVAYSDIALALIPNSEPARLLSRE